MFFVDYTERMAKLEARMESFEKSEIRQDKMIQTLDERTDEMGKFAVKIDLVVENLDKTTKNIEKTLNDFILKQETKEEEARKEEKKNQEEEVGRWKSFSFQIGKYALIVVGALATGQGILEIVQSFFK
jgi:Rad3-related DNA helicase